MAWDVTVSITLDRAITGDIKGLGEELNVLAPGQMLSRLKNSQASSLRLAVSHSLPFPSSG